MAVLDPARLLAALPADTRRLTVAYSGGRDSHALLRLAGEAGLAVRAIHVHHGLHPDADAWARHCEAVCRGLGVALTVRRVQVDPAGEGEEGAARRARYAALAAELGRDERLATAHHADDQAETLLLRVLRGTGPDGLVGILPMRPLGAGVLLRPLLAVPRREIEAYARAAGLHWLEDPANRDQRHDRSWLRQRVLPMLGERWPDLPARAARLAEGAREARALRDSLLDERLRSLAGEPPGPLPVAGLRQCPHREQRALLRRWLRRDGRRPPPAARLDSGLQALLTAAPDRRPRLVWADGEVRRHGGRLFRLPPALPALAEQTLAPPPAATGWQGLGDLRWRAVTGAGIDARRIDAVVRGRPVRPGEMLQPAGRRRRGLKHWLREAGVPPWWRARLPALESVGGELVAVAGIAVAADWQAPAGAAGWWPEWHPQAPAPAGDTGDFRTPAATR